MLKTHVYNISSVFESFSVYFVWNDALFNQFTKTKIKRRVAKNDKASCLQNQPKKYIVPQNDSVTFKVSWADVFMTVFRGNHFFKLFSIVFIISVKF